MFLFLNLNKLMLAEIAKSKTLIGKQFAKNLIYVFLSPPTSHFQQMIKMGGNSPQ